MANFVFAKNGIHLDFDSGSKLFFASSDHCRLLINLAYNNPDDNFYIIGHNNFSTINPQLRKEWFPNNNVFNTLEHTKGDLSTKYLEPLEWLNKNQVNIDYGIIGGGPTLNINVPDRVYTKGGTIGKPLDMAKRAAAPVIHTLNELGIPWISIVDDPRCLNTSKAHDLFNNPKIILSQYNTKVVCKNIKSYSDQSIVEEEIPVVYSNTEIACNLDENISLIDESWKQRRTNIGIVLNEAGTDERLVTKKLGNGHRPRYPILRDWFLNSDSWYLKDIIVYGKWDEEIIKSNTAFKGMINRDSLYPEMKTWKHSFCVPIDTGWATAKYQENLKCGVSPFMHPEYDSQKNTKIQDFYRVESQEEYLDKLSLAEDTHIKEINKGIQTCLSEDQINGQQLNDDIYSALGIDRTIKNELRDLWTPKDSLSLMDFMV